MTNVFAVSLNKLQTSKYSRKLVQNPTNIDKKCIDTRISGIILIGCFQRLANKLIQTSGQHMNHICIWIGRFQRLFEFFELKKLKTNKLRETTSNTIYQTHRNSIHQYFDENG